jgi:hypothetical protein
MLPAREQNPSAPDSDIPTMTGVPTISTRSEPRFVDDGESDSAECLLVGSAGADGFCSRAGSIWSCMVYNLGSDLVDIVGTPVIVGMSESESHTEPAKGQRTGGEEPGQMVSDSGQEYRFRKR